MIAHAKVVSVVIRLAYQMGPTLPCYAGQKAVVHILVHYSVLEHFLGSLHFALHDMAILLTFSRCTKFQQCHTQQQ